MTRGGIYALSQPFKICAKYALNMRKYAEICGKYALHFLWKRTSRPASGTFFGEVSKRGPVISPPLYLLYMQVRDVLSSSAYLRHARIHITFMDTHGWIHCFYGNAWMHTLCFTDTHRSAFCPMWLRSSREKEKNAARKLWHLQHHSKRWPQMFSTKTFKTHHIFPSSGAKGPKMRGE